MFKKKPKYTVTWESERTQPRRPLFLRMMSARLFTELNAVFEFRRR